MTNEAKGRANVATGTPERLSNEGKNPTRGDTQNSTKQAAHDTSTGGACADLRASAPPAEVVVDLLLTTAGRAWVVAVGRLLHLEDERAAVLPEDTSARLGGRAWDEAPDLDVGELLAYARVLGATIIAARIVCGALPDSRAGLRAVKAVVSVAQVSAPSYRYQRHLELLGLHWVEQCLSALELAVSDWPDRALAMAYVATSDALATLPGEARSTAEAHAAAVVEDTLPATTPEPLTLIQQALAGWEFRADDVAEIQDEDAGLGEGEWAHARNAIQILWRIGAGAQVFARLRAKGAA